ncbi:hypothetical protein KRR55_16445 [Paeniglutamicibacter sp. ABSL32-1]|uniref:hypothetical protein n=1 Tax=Paeniglutamicibacter quisquiliarum TaxID=2849498 RepID=UPI001C2D061B|nr:hypothetical protein [Paeniglutamicibacter quisquiliarum]MBV1780706.1 hypothetical protein [Paeniglutamicibacter quisquiliarum]
MVSDFGAISGYEARKYSFKVPSGASPQRLIVAAPGSGERDFVLLPAKGLVPLYPSLATMSFSAGLDARFSYVGGDLAYVELNQEFNNRGIASTMDFVIVRWARKSVVNFPNNIKCLAKVRASTHGPARHFNEILTASAVSTH